MVLNRNANKQKLISGFNLHWITLLLHISRLRIIFGYSSNPIKGLQNLRQLLKLKHQFLGNNKTKKMSLVNGKYRWALYVPGWPSRTWNQFFKSEINRYDSVRGKCNRFVNVFVAVTKKCSLQCEHCFEWEALNGKESLTVDNLKKIINNVHDQGVSQIQLTGGEPMLRINDMLELINTSPKDIEFWILTAGIHFNAQNAQKLKEAGLTGIVVSLDHFDSALHNKFRGNPKSFEWALEALKNANAQKLVTAVSICVTNSFINESNLMAYASFAKKLDVSFIQILEPKAVGHYQGKDVVLTTDNEKILEDFYLKMSFDPIYKDYPIISYHGFYQRRMGCMSAAYRSIYIDTNGAILACPFCRHSGGSALGDDFTQILSQLSAQGCPAYKSSFSIIK